MTDLDAVAEPRSRRRHPGADSGQRGQRRLPAEPAQGHHDPHPRQHQRQLRVQPRRALVALGRRRLVLRGRAPHRGQHPGLGQLEAVADVRAGGLVGQADPVQAREQPVTRAVAGEHPAGPVRTVGRRRQPDDQDRGSLGPEAGRGPAPVVLVGVRRALGARDLLTPRDEPWTGAALRDRRVQRRQVRRELS